MDNAPLFGGRNQAVGVGLVRGWHFFNQVVYLFFRKIFDSIFIDDECGENQDGALLVPHVPGNAAYRSCLYVKVHTYICTYAVKYTNVHM